MIRVGVIGVGVMGADHARKLARVVSGSELVAVSDFDPASAAALAAAARLRPTPRAGPAGPPSRPAGLVVSLRLLAAIVIFAAIAPGILMTAPALAAQLANDPAMQWRHVLAPGEAMLFDNWYETHQGVICLIRVIDGTMQTGKRVTSAGTTTSSAKPITIVGLVMPRSLRTRMLVWKKVREV